MPGFLALSARWRYPFLVGILRRAPRVFLARALAGALHGRTVMKRVWGHVITGLSLVAGGAVAFPACVHNDSTIFVQDVLAPQEVANNMPCTFTNSPTQTVLSSGILDLDFRYQYDPWYLVGNQMVAEANSQQLVTETSTVTLQGAVVRITNSQGAQLRTFTRLASATIYAAAGSVPGYAPVSVTTIDRDTILNDSEIQSLVVNAPPRSATVRLVTYVRFFGNTLGGRYVESGEFAFPVDICKGCLITFSPADISPVFPAPNCAQNPNSMGGGSTSQQSLPCYRGQDLAIDCIQCQDVPDCRGSQGPLYDAGVGVSDAGGNG
jgi:hypothetical protein